MKRQFRAMQEKMQQQAKQQEQASAAFTEQKLRSESPRPKSEDYIDFEEIRWRNTLYVLRNTYYVVFVNLGYSVIWNLDGVVYSIRQIPLPNGRRGNPFDWTN